MRLSTANDYIRFVSMLLNWGSFEGVTILKKETVQLARENHIGDIVQEWDPSRMNIDSGSATYIPKMTNG